MYQESDGVRGSFLGKCPHSCLDGVEMVLDPFIRDSVSEVIIVAINLVIIRFIWRFFNQKKRESHVCAKTINKDCKSKKKTISKNKEIN